MLVVPIPPSLRQCPLLHSLRRTVHSAEGAEEKFPLVTMEL